MRTTGIVLGGIAVAVVAAGALVWNQLATEAPLPVSAFPPWYPAANEQGDPPFADFEAHVPCRIDPVPDPACQRVKFGLVLYRDPVTHDPSTYVMSIIRVGVGDDREVHQGEWTIDRGVALDPAATVYRLDGVPGHLDSYWAVGDGILLLLDEEGMPRVGDAGYGYTLNSTPLRMGE